MNANSRPGTVRRRLLVLVVALGAGVATDVRADVPRVAAQPLDLAARVLEASDHFRQKRYAAARLLFDAVLASDPEVDERATIAFNAAVCSYALEEYADARRRFDLISRQASDLAPLARVNAGHAALRAGNLEGAEAYAKSGQALPADVEARRQALLAEIADAREARAEREVDQLIDAGFAAVAQQQWPAARSQFSRALTRARADQANDIADAHYGLGLVSAQLGDPSRAQHDFESSLQHRPGDARVLLALGRATDDVLRLYRLPKTGTSAFVSMGVGADGNATQSGSGDVIVTSQGPRESSGYLAGVLELGLAWRSSRRTALGLNYSGDVLALLNPGVDDLSLQAHELVSRWQWAPTTSTRLRLDAGGAYVLTGLQPMRPFEWDAVVNVSGELDTGPRSRARLQFGERLVRASELVYLDGHRLQLTATELWFLGSWELTAQAGLRYYAAGVQEIELASDAYAPCTPNCDRGKYKNPLGYWSPGLGTGVGWQMTSRLRLSALLRAEYRGYLEPSQIPGFRASKKVRQDFRYRGQLGAELSLDASGRFRVTLDQTLVINSSNVAFDPRDAAHQYDYGDRNFVQPTTELGISASLP